MAAALIRVEKKLDTVVSQLADLLAQPIVPSTGQPPDALPISERDEAAIVAIARVINGPFTALELIARLDRLGDGAIPVLGSCDPRVVGAKLRTLAGRKVGPFMIERVKRSNRGRQWVVSVDQH
jgi:hypothetical protein